MGFEYACTASDGIINDFTIFANVKSRTAEHVTIERYQKHGALKLKDVTLTSGQFAAYYQKIR